MKRFWMHGKTHPLPLTAATVSLLLAACGGGGNDDTAVSASPTATPGAASTTTTVNINTPGTGSTSTTGSSGSSSSNSTGASSSTGTTGSSASSTTTDNASGSNSGSTGQSATQASDSNTAGAGNTDGDAQNSGTGSQADTTGNTAEATPPAPVPSVSAQGVRGDVLLAMIDQRACFTPLHSGAQHSNTPPVSTSKSHSADANSYTVNYSGIVMGMPDGIRCERHPESHVYSNPMQPGSYHFSMRTSAQYRYNSWVSYFGSPFITRGVNAADARFTLEVTDAQFSLGAQVDVQLGEDLSYLAKDHHGRDAPKGRHYESQYSGTVVSFQRQALVPFGTLNQWQDGAGNNVRLMLIHADNEGANVVRLCTNLNSDLAKRLHCITWQVPENWSWGQELVGGKHYLIDDRSVYPNESGFLYWNVQPPAN